MLFAEIVVVENRGTAYRLSAIRCGWRRFGLYQGE